MHTSPLTPVLLPTPATRGKGAERMRLQRTASRDAVHASALARGAELGELEANDLGAPLPSNAWHWSLTHDADWSAGVVDTEPIGIDLERIGLRREDLVRQALSHAEEALFAGERALAFTRSWTAKEAVLKAAGVGLLELSRCSVVNVTSEHASIEHGGRVHLVRQWFHGDHVLALTVRHLEQDVHWTGLAVAGSGT